MDTEQPSSTSGYTNPLDFNAMNVFSNHTEMASKGYCRLFKAQRYGRWFALKALQPQYAENPQYAAMLEKEFQCAIMLNHPNIAATYGIETDAVAGRCIVMEYVEGRTLAEFMKENPLHYLLTNFTSFMSKLKMHMETEFKISLRKFSHQALNMIKKHIRLFPLL